VLRLRCSARFLEKIVVGSCTDPAKDS